MALSNSQRWLVATAISWIAATAMSWLLREESAHSGELDALNVRIEKRGLLVAAMARQR